MGELVELNKKEYSANAVRRTDDANNYIMTMLTLSGSHFKWTTLSINRCDNIDKYYLLLK